MKKTIIYQNDKGEGNFRFWAENYDEAGMEHWLEASWYCDDQRVGAKHISDILAKGHTIFAHGEVLCAARRRQRVGC